MYSQLKSLLPAYSLTLFGCTSTDEHRWGSTTSLTPSWQQIRTAAKNAATDPHTWVPVAGAALLSMGDLDEQTAEWAAEHNPLFGSKQRAQDASDTLRNLARLNYLATAVATPSGIGWQAIENKSKAIAVGLLASKSTSTLTGKLKEQTQRKRPDNINDDSFPSGHTSGATVASTLAVRNLDAIPLSKRTRTGWKAASYGLAGLTGWARVEGERHYPTDVLVGYALGNFLGAFFNEAFINPQYQQRIVILPSLTPAGDTMLTIQLFW